ncbi:MAG: hypothetical protein ACYCT9_04430 [Leptospirillum sp.]|jgi:hypothetical protein
MIDLKLKKLVGIVGAVSAVISFGTVAMADSMENMSGMSSDQNSMNHQKKVMMGDKTMMDHHIDKKMSMKPSKRKMSSMKQKTSSADESNIKMQK